MYTWIWRHLPGGLVGKLAGTVVLLAAAVALLFFIVFPWAEPRLPFNDVTVDHSTTQPTSPSPATTPVPESPSP